MNMTVTDDTKSLRTPIVCVMGHVDHGKTTLLDKVRGTGVAKKEAGAITQHIGATEVPIEVINELCSALIKGDGFFNVPGLLFIDTPGHHAFTTLRNRGGALADLAVLIVDVMEGFQPQSLEVLRILRNFKTPFVLAVNKIDRINGWQPKSWAPFQLAYKNQANRVQQMLDEKTYEIIGELAEHGFSADRYDRIRDFQRNIGVLPMSAKTGEGIPDLLMILVGLAQQFLEENLRLHASGPGIGSILELKEEKGLGLTLDVILSDGKLRKDDIIVVGGKDEPIVTKVRALLKPGPMSELRIEDKFQRVNSVTAAAGIKVVAPNIENALAGLPLHVVKDMSDLDLVIEEVRSNRELKIDIEQVGVLIKADTVGSLEALASELKSVSVPIQKADIGDISKRDVVEAQTINEPLLSAILGFNVDILPDAKEEIQNTGLNVFTSNVIYAIVDDYTEWQAKLKELIEKEQFGAVTMPGKVRILPECIFRTNKPAIVGVEVIGGTIKTGSYLIRENGARVGVLKGIQDKGENIKTAKYKDEVAISIDGPTVGRHIKENDILYVDINEKDTNKIETERYDDLSSDELEAFEGFLKIKRKDNPFWGK